MRMVVLVHSGHNRPRTSDPRSFVGERQERFALGTTEVLPTLLAYEE